jgi:hypothetical protein
MTAKKDLKRRIRERQERTGESYVVARRRVLAEREEDRGAAPEAPKPTTTVVAPPPMPGSAYREVIAAFPDMYRTEADGPIIVVEMEDFTELATALGFRCSIAITTHLSKLVDPRVVLERFREVVLGTSADPAMESICGVALLGLDPVQHVYQPDWFQKMQRFVARVKVGVGGVSESGTMLAMTIQGKEGPVMMVCHLGFGIAQKSRPRIVLTTAETAGFFVEPIAMRKLATR